MATAKDRSSSGYNAEHIQVLEGLDPVRKRPGMYIGSTGTLGLHHLVWEVVDNGVDEAMAGYATRVDVTLLADGGCRVNDNGRGIPVDEHPQYKGKSAAEIVLTTLHAGGKFGGGGYKVSGGLHGVGVSVVNALSTKLDLEVRREGNVYRQSYAAVRDGRNVRPGVPQGKLKLTGKAGRAGNGTTVTFWPDPTVFEETEFRAATVLERLQVMAFLNRGLTIAFTDERPGHRDQQAFCFDGGISDFVAHLNTSKEPLFKDVGYFSAAEPEGEVEVAWQWNTGFNEGMHTFANGISTTEGGMHAEGFETRAHQRDQQVRQGPRTSEEQGRVAAGRRRPRGSHRDRVGAPRRAAVRGSDQVEARQYRNPFDGRATHQRALRSLARGTSHRCQGHRRQGQHGGEGAHCGEGRGELTRRKSALEGVGMPDKLADCSQRTADDTELFIVEGNSAGGSARDARDPRVQAILPLRGKVLNVERASLDKILANAEIQALVAAIGGGIGNDFDLDKVRYERVVILSDADVDGGHIRTLLITFFFRQMFPLVEAKRLYVAQPPLYSVEVSGKKSYVADDAARARLIDEQPNRNLVFARFKGLGEMDYPELRETCMDPATRTLVQIDVDQASVCDDILAKLMGDDVEHRRQWIQHNAKDVRFLDI